MRTEAYRYEPPVWARVWDDPHITLPTDRELVEELDAYRPKSDGDLILFATPIEPDPRRETTASRVSAAFGIATAFAALLYFFGHVIAALAMGRL